MKLLGYDCNGVMVKPEADIRSKDGEPSKIVLSVGETMLIAITSAEQLRDIRRALHSCGEAIGWPTRVLGKTTGRFARGEDED